MTQATPGRLAQYHSLLSGMLGRLPDDLIVEARRWLAAGSDRDVARGLAFAAKASGTAVTDVEAALMELAGPVDGLARVHELDLPPFSLSPTGPRTMAGNPDVEYNLDLTRPNPGQWRTDDMDRAIITAISIADVQGRGLWRTWKFPAEDSLWPAPRRIYLFQVDSPAEPDRLPGVTVALMDALEAAGEVQPLVEVFVEPGALAPFPRTALAFSALLWASETGSEIRIAPLYDDYREGRGPGFDDGHPLLTDSETDSVLSYLEGGELLLISPELMPDVLDPNGPGAPIAYRTDGVWIWSAATAYYLERHRLAPHPDLLQHVRANGREVAPVSAVGLHRALNRLYSQDMYR